MKIITLTYKSTNIYLLELNKGWLMIDAGWPDTLHLFLSLLKHKDIDIKDIIYLLVTHYHPDHAGLAQNFKDLGVNLILHETQIPFIDKLNVLIRKNQKINYKNITLDNCTIVSSVDSRSLLKKLGINGEVIYTPGHSEDSVTLIIDNNCAFTGDLPNVSLVEAYNDKILESSWKLIQTYKEVLKIYPAHGDSYFL